MTVTDEMLDRREPHGTTCSPVSAAMTPVEAMARVDRRTDFGCILTMVL